MQFHKLIVHFASLAMVCLIAVPAEGQIASRPVEEWIKTLDGPQRVADMKIGELVAALKLQPGQTVADIGAGTGLLVVPLANAVGARGRVYAVEIDAGFFPQIRKRVDAAGVKNVDTVLGKFTDLVPETAGGDAAALVGGTAAILLLAATITLDGPRDALETCATHVVDGLVFAFKAMGVVVPIAGFFFIGNSDFAGRIMSLGDDATAPGFLFDLVASVQDSIPDVPLVMAFGMLLIGMATGLDGSGFSGLPLTGSLSGALGPASGVDPETLAAIGQMGAIWTGGGTLIAWSSLLAVAGFARVPVLELVRQLFLPVIAGLAAATVVAVVFF